MATTQKQAIAVGSRMAKKFFDLRSRKGSRNIEVHIDEVTLAALLALAWEQGNEFGRREQAVIDSAPRRSAAIRIGPGSKPLVLTAPEPTTERRETPLKESPPSFGPPPACPPGCGCRGGDGPCTVYPEVP